MKGVQWHQQPLDNDKYSEGDNGNFVCIPQCSDCYLVDVRYLFKPKAPNGCLFPIVGEANCKCRHPYLRCKNCNAIFEFSNGTSVCCPKERNALKVKEHYVIIHMQFNVQ